MYAYHTEENNPFLLALFQDTAICAGTNLNVHPDDEMLGFLYHFQGGQRDQALAMYFHSGLVIWSTLKQIVEWRFGGLDGVRGLLDFASGYGRVTRFMVRDLPPERIWVADIYAEGVRFQREQLGVHGLVSTASPDDFDCAEKFDCILVSSLFSHLPAATFSAWLARLYGLLAPGGLLVFSVHGESLLGPGRSMPPEGFLFERISESGSLDKGQYGSAWVTEGFVRAAVAAVAPAASVHRIPKGFANFQDLYVVVDRPGESFAGLAVRPSLDGSLDHCSFVPPDRLEMVGWVADRITGAPPVAVRAVVGGVVVAETRELPPRDDADRLFLASERVQAVGFHLTVPLPPGAPRPAGLAVRMVRGDGTGTEVELWAGTIEGALLRSARLDLLATKSLLQRSQTEHEARLAAATARIGALEAGIAALQADVAQVQAAAAHESGVLRTRIAAMEASRFWKLRDRWFALKRLLRLTDER